MHTCHLRNWNCKLLLYGQHLPSLCRIEMILPNTLKEITNLNWAHYNMVAQISHCNPMNMSWMQFWKILIIQKSCPCIPSPSLLCHIVQPVRSPLKDNITCITLDWFNKCSLTKEVEMSVILSLVSLVIVHGWHCTMK